MENPFEDPALAQALARAVAPYAIVQLDVEGKVLAANDAYSRLLRVPLDRMVGRSLTDCYEEVDLGAVQHVLQRCMAGETVVTQSLRRTLDGRTLMLYCIFAGVLDSDGEPNRVCAVVIDTSREYQDFRDKADIVGAVSRAQALVEFTPAGEVVNANHIFLDCLGYSSVEEVRGRHHRMFVDPVEAASRPYAELWAALAQGEYRNGEFCRIRRDGKPVWITASYTAVTDYAGRVTRVIELATEITHRKQAFERLVEGIACMAEGDLSARMGLPPDPEFADVFAGFDRSLEDIGDIVDDIRARAGMMNDEAAQIAEGAENLARRGESQAASLEQTAAAVEQISGNITMTSQSAREADTAARSAEQIVLLGAETVGRAIDAMTRIDEHTRRMGEFTRVIENFAFQTNLLSINAAVEAARAGEVGRGFAVVANEVRNLAQQSAKASQSIAELIGKSEAEVTTGVRLVKEAGDALDRIRSAVGAMASGVADIAHATTEQAIGVREVSESLSQLDGVNQSNLTLSDSNAAAAASLNDQVSEMMMLLGRFRTDQDSRIAPATPGRQPQSGGTWSADRPLTPAPAPITSRYATEPAAPGRGRRSA